MMHPKILVVYYSRTGVTKKLAENIAKELHADGEELVDIKKRKGLW
jgi:flavodoxin